MNWKKLLTSISGLFIILAFSFSILNSPNDIVYGFYFFSILFGGYFVILAAIKGIIRKKIFNINFLVIIATLSAFYIEQLAEAAAIIFFFSLAELFEEFGIERSKKAIKLMISRSPKKAKLKSGQSLPIKKIKVGDVIVARPGDIIPLDGIIIKGFSSIDESTITGESIPNDKGEKDFVFAGAVSLNGYLEIEVTKTGKDSTFSKIIQLVESAQKSKIPVQKFIDSFAKYYTPAIIATAFLVAIMPPLLLEQDPIKWFYQSLVLLVIACPCALVVSTPVSLASAIGRASYNGILLKGGKYLELLAKTKIVAFDKTKTLTLGQQYVSDVIPFEGFTKKELLADAAGIEVFSSHPLSKSIIDFARKQNISYHKMKDYKYIPGKGGTAKCTVCKNINLIGNVKFVCLNTKLTKEVVEKIKDLEEIGKTVVLISEGKKIIGALGISDKIRPEAIKAIKELDQAGIKTAILTGDSIKVANYVGSQLGIKKIYASLLPDKKENKIKELKKEYGTTIMVGDGINDAPSLASASVGISMGSDGSEIAIETADVTLMNNNLLNIPFSIYLGKKTLKTIHINIILSISVKILFLILAIFGLAGLKYAIGFDAGVAIIVILNSLRLFRLKSEKKG